MVLLLCGQSLFDGKVPTHCKSVCSCPLLPSWTCCESTHCAFCGCLQQLQNGNTTHFFWQKQGAFGAFVSTDANFSSRTFLFLGAHTLSASPPCSKQHQHHRDQLHWCPCHECLELQSHPDTSTTAPSALSLWCILLSNRRALLFPPPLQSNTLLLLNKMQSVGN